MRDHRNICPALVYSITFAKDLCVVPDDVAVEGVLLSNLPFSLRTTQLYPLAIYGLAWLGT
jgi:hypothetical protein